MHVCRERESVRFPTDLTDSHLLGGPEAFAGVRLEDLAVSEPLATIVLEMAVPSRMPPAFLCRAQRILLSSRYAWIQSPIIAG